MSAAEPFGGFVRELDGYPASLKCIAEAIGEGGFDGEWRLLALHCRDRAERELCPDLVLDYAPKRRSPSQGTATSTSTAKGRVRFWDHGDPLKAIPAAVYLRALAGADVSSSGRLRCPHPAHDDRHPSAKAYGTTWTCFACGAGGTIIDLGAALYGIEPTGPGYRQIRERLLAELGLAEGRRA